MCWLWVKKRCAVGNEVKLVVNLTSNLEFEYRIESYDVVYLWNNVVDQWHGNICPLNSSLLWLQHFPYACFACSVHLNSVFNFVLLTFTPPINLVTGKAWKFHKSSHILQKYIFVTIISIKHTYHFWGYLCSGLGGFKRKIAL